MVPPQIATIETPRTLPTDPAQSGVELLQKRELQKQHITIPNTIHEQHPLQSQSVVEKRSVPDTRECELSICDSSDTIETSAVDYSLNSPRDTIHAVHNIHDIHDKRMADDTKSNVAAPDTSNNLPIKPPAVVNTSPTPPASSPTPRDNTSAAKMTSKDKPNGDNGGGIRRGLSSLFRRNTSNAQNNFAVTSDSRPLTQGRGGSDPILNKPTKASDTNTSNSITTSGSATPPSQDASTQSFNVNGADDASESNARSNNLEPSSNQFFGRNKHRASSGLGIRDKFITFATTPKDVSKKDKRHRATSMDLETATSANAGRNDDQGNPPLQTILTQNEWAIAPAAGTGLKARRMSVSLPDDFWVDSVDLREEFADQSKLIGRRGKTLGRGATSKVTIMVRKGYPTELVAVKEFRGKQENESTEEYDKKVKSEYSIAKSLHHPNIVETIRLCTYNGRWNHVMEYCEEGDLFNFVSKGYLKAKEREVDRLCLFKQLVQGIHYLHSHGIAHRDIKLENLLITSGSKLKITDFGVSEVFSGIHPGLRQAGGECGKEMNEIRLCAPGICGSLPYIAPEVVAKKESYDPRGLDVWSAAIVMLHLIFGGALWHSADASDPAYSKLLRGWEKWQLKDPSNPSRPITETNYPSIEPFDKHIEPPALRRMLISMLRPDPSARITVEQVVKKGWVRGIECCQVDSFEESKCEVDASKKGGCEGVGRVVRHNHLPPKEHIGHRFVRLPGRNDMYS